MFNPVSTGVLAPKYIGRDSVAGRSVNPPVPAKLPPQSISSPVKTRSLLPSVTDPI